MSFPVNSKADSLFFFNKVSKTSLNMLQGKEKKVISTYSSQPSWGDTFPGNLSPDPLAHHAL